MRGRRRRPVDLRVPRRHHPQHRRLRTRLPQRHNDSARAELPLDAEHPVGGQLRHLPQHRPPREAAVDRRRRGRTDRRLRRRQRARRGPVRRRGDRRARRPRRHHLQRRRGVLPHQQLVARAGRGVHPRRHSVQSRWRRSLLRAQGDPRHRRLPAGAGQPRRRGQHAAHPQHPAPRHRRPGRGVRRGVRREHRRQLQRRAAGGRRGQGADAEHPRRRRRSPASSRCSTNCAARLDGELGELVEAVLDRTGYRAELESSSDPQDLARLDNLNELVSVAHEFSIDLANAEALGNRPGRRGRARHRGARRSSWSGCRWSPTPTNCPSTAPAW